MKQRAIQHFKRVDPILASVIPLVDVPDLNPAPDPFVHLVDSIIGQQLSEKAGDTIAARFHGLFPSTVTPAQILNVTDDAMRGVGISRSKVQYIKNIAVATRDGVIDFDALSSMDNEAVIMTLTQIKGVGRWTAEMFLMFALARPDVFSTGDLGLKRAIQRLYKIEHDPSADELIARSSPWSPYRTWASRILWRSLALK